MSLVVQAHDRWDCVAMSMEIAISVLFDRGKKYLIIQSAALHMALIVGSITFFGSLVACAKLQGWPKVFAFVYRISLRLPPRSHYPDTGYYRRALQLA